MSSGSRWRQRLGEAVVIVGSILMAFAIDAMWEARVEREHEREILAAILQDMRSNLEELDRVQGTVDDNELVVSFFLAHSPAELRTVSMDSALVAIGALMGAATFSGYEGSLSAENLSQIRDVQLRNDLGAWIGQAGDVVEDGPYLRNGVDRLSRLPSSSAALRVIARSSELAVEAPTPGEAFAGLRADEGFVDELLRHAVITAINQRKLARLRETTERILARLEG